METGWPHFSACISFDIVIACMIGRSPQKMLPASRKQNELLATLPGGSRQIKNIFPLFSLSAPVLCLHMLNKKFKRDGKLKKKPH